MLQGRRDGRGLSFAVHDQLHTIIRQVCVLEGDLPLRSCWIAGDIRDEAPMVQCWNCLTEAYHSAGTHNFLGSASCPTTGTFREQRSPHTDKSFHCLCA